MHELMFKTKHCITFGSILYTCGVHPYNFDPPSEILDPPLNNENFQYDHVSRNE